MDTMIREGSERALGELLRSLVFPQPGYGCYNTFEVRYAAEPWPEDRIREVTEQMIDPEYVNEITDIAEGYTMIIDEYTIDTYWFWEGDGTLVFWVYRDDTLLRALVNDDCKKDYTWQSFEPSFI